MSAEISPELREKMAEWVELKKQLASARDDMKVLNKREKELKDFIKDFMKDNKIDKINLRKGKVAYKETKRKPAFSKQAVQIGLEIYFNGDETQVESAMNCILDNLSADAVETSTISLTGIKD